MRLTAATLAVIITITVLSLPAYGNEYRGGEPAVHAYNCHNLCYEGESSFPCTVQP